MSNRDHIKDDVRTININGVNVLWCFRYGCDVQYLIYHRHRYHTDEELAAYAREEELWKDPAYRAKKIAESDKLVEEMVARRRAWKD